MRESACRRGSVSVVAIAAVAACAGIGAAVAPSSASAGATSLRPGGAPGVGGMLVLSGSPHDHSTLSDGHRDPTVIADWLERHHNELGVDFADLTEHSDFFPATYQNPSLNPWPELAGVAASHSVPGFSFLRGFEWTNDLENHINVLGSANWTARFGTGEGSTRMAGFWNWLATTPQPDPTGTGVGIQFGGADGVGQFNHLGDKGALNWDDYAYDAGAAKVMGLMEVRGDAGLHGVGNSDAGWYWFALSQGWTLSPTMDWDWHPWEQQVNSDGSDNAANPAIGSRCGVDGYLTCQRTLVVAAANTPAAIIDALEHRRTSASERPDLWATLRGPDGSWQGDTVSAAPGTDITLTVDAGSADQLTGVDIVSDASASRPDATVPAYPSFFYADNPQSDWGSGQYFVSYAEQHAKWVASGGHATAKHWIHANGSETRFGQPPSDTVVAHVAMSGQRDTRQVTVHVPTAPSGRPDGKHFYYAIVHAATPDPSGSAPMDTRAWTGPLLTTASPVVAAPETPLGPLPLVGGSALLAGAAWAWRRRSVTAWTRRHLDNSGGPAQ